MEISELDELLALRKSLLNAEDTVPSGAICSQARQCIIGRLETLMASGLVDTIILDEAAEKLARYEEDDFRSWRQEVLDSIDLCVERMKAYQQMKEAAPPYVLS